MILRFCEGGVLDVGLTTVADSLAYGMHGKLTVLRASFFIAEIPWVHRGALSGCLQGRCEIYIVFSCFLAFFCGLASVLWEFCSVGSWLCRAKGAE